AIIPAASHRFGINITVETADGMLVLSRRGPITDSYHGAMHSGVNENMKAADLGTGTMAVEHAVSRALHEELGIRTSDRSTRIHTVGVDSGAHVWGVWGHVRLNSLTA